jgi:hypothetical protein
VKYTASLERMFGATPKRVLLVELGFTTMACYHNPTVPHI